MSHGLQCESGLYIAVPIYDEVAEEECGCIYLSILNREEHYLNTKICHLLNRQDLAY